MASNHRPYKGTNTYGRMSCQGGANKRWKAHLNANNDVAETREARIEEKKNYEKGQVSESKKKYAEEAARMQAEYGMVVEEQPEEEEAPSSSSTFVPRWRQEKNLLKSLFPAPVTRILHDDQEIFKNKSSMQKYYKRELDPAEWERNTKLLADVVEKYLGCDIAVPDTVDKSSSSNDGKGSIILDHEKV